MADAFLSYARNDTRYFALLVRMLTYHRIDVWYDSGGIRAGSAYRREIDKALSQARCLLVMVSAHAARSRWIAREVTHFRSAQPDACIIPLLFDRTAPDEIFEGLGEVHAISFREDLDAGFSKLVGAFGKPLLPIVEQRTREDRRATERRRGDRRRAPTETRLRIGMWKNFAAATGFGEYEDFGEMQPVRARAATGGSDTTPPSSSEQDSAPRPSASTAIVPSSRITAVNRLAVVFTADNSELHRYRFFDRANEHEIDLDFELIRAMAHATCREMEVFGRLKNVYVVERLAERLARDYEVRPRDRRTGDRRSATDRRRTTREDVGGP